MHYRSIMSEEMKNPTEQLPLLKVHMMGSFFLEYGDQPISFRKTMATKSMRLLQIFLYNKDNGISRGRLFSCGTYVYLWKDHPLADKTEITMEELKEYPCLSFDQGSNNSFFLAEEVLSTYEYKRIIKANDRATMLNLMVGLNGYTLCSGIICEELNGSDYRAVPLHADENMMIGYVSRKGMSTSAMGLQYLEEIRKYKEFVL